MRVRHSILASVAFLAMVVASVVLPVAASAHVNRTVGPYTFFLVLIEEPVYQDNRAGFEFWVHEGERVVRGVDQTLHAVASNGARDEALVISPINAQGLYDVEADGQGRRFDPGRGGDWTLHLTGTIQETAVDVSFPATFPAYPRISSTSPATAPVAPSEGIDVWTFVDAGLLLAAVIWGGRKINRGRRRSTTELTAAIPIAGPPV